MATITGDFFGDSELAGLGVEGLVSLEGGGSLGRSGTGTQKVLQEWSLPSEAFEQKQEIKDGDRDEADIMVGESETEAGSAMQTVTVEDKTSSMVVWGTHAQDTRPLWSPLLATREALTWLAEQGDVQNAVSMFLALSGGRNCPEKVRSLIDENTLEHWWLSYVDLLQKLKLYTNANEVQKYFGMQGMTSNYLLTDSESVLASKCPHPEPAEHHRVPGLHQVWPGPEQSHLVV